MDRIKTAVLLVGGEGTRLSEYSKGLPKPLVPLNGKPLLYWSINWLKSEGIENIVFATGDKKYPVSSFMSEYSNFGLSNVCYSENSKEGGTAEAFRLAIGRYVSDENFVGMNGDELTNMDLRYMSELHLKKSPLITMALSPFNCPFSTVELDSDTNKVVRFKYGKILHDLPISMGLYVMNRKLAEMIPEKGSIEDILFTSLAQKGQVLGHMLRSGEEWATVNNPKDVKIAEKKLEYWGKC